MTKAALEHAARNMPPEFASEFVHLDADIVCSQFPELDAKTALWTLFVVAAGGQGVYGQKLYLTFGADLLKMARQIGIDDDEFDEWLHAAECAIGSGSVRLVN